MAKATIATKKFSEDLTSVDWTFTDGEVITIDITQIPEETLKQVTLLGISSKGGDSYAGESDLGVAKAKVRQVRDNLYAGIFRASGGGGQISDLAKALSQISGQTIEASVEVITSLEPAEVSKLKKHPDIDDLISQWKYERKRAAIEANRQSGSGLDIGAILNQG